jgi:hypothetical protein
MLSHMRTTIDLNDELFRQAKRRAADDGLTLRELIESALRTYLTRRRDKRPYTFRWRTEGGGLQPGLDIDDWASFKRALDEDWLEYMDRKLKGGGSE